MKFFLRAILVTLLLFSSFTHADPNPDVGRRVRQTLSDTLSINFEQKQDDLMSIRNNYSYDAWNALTGFLSNYINITHSQQLTVRPFFKGNPTIVKQGMSSGIHFWRVNDTVVLPELKVELSFSFIVLLKDINDGSPYVIQSMNIIKRDY